MGHAVKDSWPRDGAVLTNRGGEAAFAFFSDATLGVDPDFQFALYQASQKTVLPGDRLDGARRLSRPARGTTASAQRTCAQTFVQTFGARRLSAARSIRREVTNLMSRLRRRARCTDYATGISLMVQTVITSPSFVYRTELGPTTLTADASGKFPDTTLTPYEIASQLGFLLPGVAARRSA